METEQTNIIEAIVQEVAEEAMAVTRAQNNIRCERTQNVGPKIGGPVMKQPIFHWEAGDKYNKL